MNIFVTKMKEGIGQFETADEEGLALNEISIMKISTQKKVCVDFNFKEGNVKGKRTSKNMRPVYNNDKLFYTPGFQNDEEKISSQLDRKVHKYLHNDRIKAQLSEVDCQQILVARPSERNSYCTICKERFEDYLSHLKEANHSKRMNSSEFNEDINKLCRMFKQSEKEKQKEMEDDQIILSERKSRKRVKKDTSKEDLYQEMQMETKKYQGKFNLSNVSKRSEQQILINLLLIENKTL